MAGKITTIPATRKLYTGASLTAPSVKRVAGYARVSTDHEDQLTSYQAQVDYYTQYISSQPGWQLAGIYTDEGITGTSTRRREGFKNMINDALEGRIDLIVTKSVSRFARNTVDTLTHVRRLKDAGVEVYFEKENIHTLDAKGELLITIMSSLAQEEARSISENVTWGHRKRFADGKAIIPYKNILGYKRGDGDSLVIDETQAPTVRLIYQLFLEGKSITEIKHELEAKKLLTPRGKTRWAVSTIRSILSNEKYKGDLLIQKTIVTDFLTKQTKTNEGEAPQYYVSGRHEPIIDPVVWDQVQVELATRHGKSKTSKVGLFSSRLKCADCGAWYGRKTWASNTTYKHTVWQCNNKYGHDQPCRTATLRDEQIQDAYLKALTKLAKQLKTDSHLTQVIDAVFATDGLEQKLGKLDSQIAQLEERLDEMIHENQIASQNQDDYLRRFTKLEAEYQQALSDKQQILAEIETRNSRRATITAAYQQLADQQIQHFQPSQWTALIDHAIIGEDEIRFVFRTGTKSTVPIN